MVPEWKPENDITKISYCFFDSDVIRRHILIAQRH